MTREEARKISKALDNIDSFECFADMIEQTINQASEICGIDPDEMFISELRKVLDEELKFRKSILEGM